MRAEAMRRRRARRAAALATVMLLATAATLLAACGRVGPVRPPGPPEQITYPRTYPSR